MASTFTSDIAGMLGATRQTSMSRTGEKPPQGDAFRKAAETVSEETSEEQDKAPDTEADATGMGAWSLPPAEASEAAEGEGETVAGAVEFAGAAVPAEAEAAEDGAAGDASGKEVAATSDGEAKLAGDAKLAAESPDVPVTAGAAADGPIKKGEQPSETPRPGTAAINPAQVAKLPAETAAAPAAGEEAVLNAAMAVTEPQARPSKDAAPDRRRASASEAAEPARETASAVRTVEPAATATPAIPATAEAVPQGDTRSRSERARDTIQPMQAAAPEPEQAASRETGPRPAVQATAHPEADQPILASAEGDSTALTAAAPKDGGGAQQPLWSSAQPLVQTAGIQTAASPLIQMMAANPQAVVVAAPADIVDIVSGKLNADDGTDRLLVQLDPPELGRVSIDFKFDANGLQHVVVTGESPEAMRQLRQLHFQLAQTLEQHGLTGQDMTFRQQTSQQQQGQARGLFDPQAADGPEAMMASIPAPAMMRSQPVLSGAARLNIKL